MAPLRNDKNPDQISEVRAITSAVTVSGGSSNISDPGLFTGAAGLCFEVLVTEISHAIFIVALLRPRYLKFKLYKFPESHYFDRSLSGIKPLFGVNRVNISELTFHSELLTFSDCHLIFMWLGM